MQPITVNTQVFSQLIKDWQDPKTQRTFHKLAENLELFHSVYIDKINQRSQWWYQFREIRNNISDFNVKKLFDDLIGPRNIKYIPIEINEKQDSFLELTNRTPDKIGLSTAKIISEELTFYDLKVFNSTEYNAANYLFRIPKIITISPGEEFSNMKLFEPFIRDATKLEFCDLFLFKNPQYEDDAEFLFCLLNSCKKINSVEIHCEPNKLNILQIKVRDRIEKQFGKTVFSNFIKYNPPTKDVNHDRFIIVDTDKISIKLTASFNNFRKLDNGSFRSKDSFSIIIEKGRKYFD